MSLSVLRGELKSNFKDFNSQWKKELREVASKHSSERKVFQDSYTRVASIQAWRTKVVAERMDDDSAAFFFEAQNDLLISHCLANCGSFRQALKSLRSCIENVFSALYYMDHPVELHRWLQGKYKIGFTELHNYLASHPRLHGAGANVTGLPILQSEYATLSKAVHASAKHFRITTDLTDTKLWVKDVPSIRQWSTRERQVITALNSLLLHMFANNLHGAKHRPLREMLALVIPTARRAEIRRRLSVNIPH